MSSHVYISVLPNTTLFKGDESSLVDQISDCAQSADKFC